ncbi:Nn.00g090500.m01.CDS01 [Neocucurbitaria sp. VM-36]
MLSPKTIANFFLSLVLIAVFFLGSTELRIAVGTLSSWALGLIAQRRLPLPAGFRRAFLVYLFVSFWLLAATNDIFYENTLGRILDLFFARCPQDPDVPGSGFTDWHETFARRHRDGIAFAYRFLRFAVCATLGFASLPLIIPLVHWQVIELRKSAELERCLVYSDKTGEYPPWLIERRERMRPQMPPPKRDTRYMRLGDDIIFVCGPGGGFERVVAGDYEGAISRRRGISKEFA